MNRRRSLARIRFCGERYLSSYEGSNTRRTVDLDCAQCCSGAVPELLKPYGAANPVVFDLGNYLPVFDPGLDLEFVGASVLEDVRNRFEDDEGDRRLDSERDKFRTEIELNNDGRSGYSQLNSGGKRQVGIHVVDGKEIGTGSNQASS